MNEDAPNANTASEAQADMEARIAALRARIQERAAAQDWPGAADDAYALGRLYDDEHRFEEAVDAHVAAFDLRHRWLGPDDIRTNQSCYEVGELSRVLYRFEEAEYYFVRALDVEGVNPVGGDFTAKLFNNLAEVYTSLGRYDDAEPLFAEALRRRVAAGGEDGERAWRTRAVIARMKLLRGGEAGAVLAEAQAAVDRVHGPAQSTWLILLADARLASGDTEGATSLFSAFLPQIPASEIGRGIPFEVYLELLRSLLIGLSVGQSVGQSTGQSWAQVIETASALPDIAERQLVGMLRRSAEVQVSRVMGRLLDIQALWLTALWRDGVVEGPAVTAAFGFVQMMKGLRTRYVRLRQPGNAQVQWLHAPQDEARLAERWRKVRELEEALVQSRLTAPDRRHWERDFKTIARRAHLRSLEREAAQGVGDLEAMFDLRPIHGAELPEDTAGLEIVFVPDVVGRHLVAPAPVDHYLGFALVGGKEATPQLVHLGLASEVDRAVAEMRRSLVDDPPAAPGLARPAWMRLAGFLGKRLLHPCWTRIASARHLHVAADRTWAAVPLDLLTAPSGQALGESMSISGCLRLSEAARRDELVRRGGEPLVLAGPDFDLPAAFTAARGRSWVHDELAGLLPEGGFGALPGAADEGADIARLLGVEALTGVWALRQELLANGSPELLHIATHGFVLPGEREDTLGLSAPIGNALQRRSVLDDPLQRCGLAFAGANAALLGRPLPEAVGNGIVYASAIQQLNLQQTDLVVLSACRSGLGELTDGDGAHGLRRAFLAAGCRSVVATLWDIPDDSSRLFSTSFYTAVLAGRSRIEALREARDLVKAQHPLDPLHWAGFVLDGDTGPLRRFHPLADLKVASLNFARWMASDADRDQAMRGLAASIATGGDDGEVRTVQALRQAIRQAMTEDGSLQSGAAGLLARHADLANHLGDHERAIADYRRALDEQGLSETRRLAFRYNIAKIHQQGGRDDEAVTGYTQLLDQGPDAALRATALVNRSMAHWALGDTAAACADADAVIADAQAPVIQRWMACLNRAGFVAEADPAGSLANVETALSLEVEVEASERARVRVFAVQLMLRTGQDARARSEMAALDGLAELDAESRGLLASCQAAAGGAPAG